MYAYIKGILADIEKDCLVIDNAGIGYNVHIYSAETLSLPEIGEEIKVYTYTSVGEDKFMLYGFLDKAELDLFKLLISVNGVGPKSAQAMLAVLGVEEIAAAIVTEDVKTISKTPGLGAKTAGRLINDLKDKVGAYSLPGNVLKTDKNVSKAEKFTETEEECITALVNLGYPRSNAIKAVQMVENRENLSTEELIKPALKNVITL